VKKLILVLFALITVAISIEYKYHHVFRFISKKLLPINHGLPKWFDKKILFHPSDWVAPVLCVLVLFLVRKRPPKEVLLCAMLPVFAALSIAASPLAHVPVLYLHLWQYLTPVFLFAAAAMLDEELKPRVVKAVLGTLVCMGTFQALIAMAQYFGQHSLGLRWLGEMEFSRQNLQNAAITATPDGKLWTFGSTSPFEVAVRAAGTLSHPNVLGGFLMMTALATMSLTRGKLRAVLMALQLTALTLSFSRAALFGFVLGFGVWLFCQVQQRKLVKQAVATVVGSFALIFCLFHQQIIHRGGIVNYNQLAQQSDSVRLTYQTIAFRMIEKKPLLGIGHQQFMMRTGEYLLPGQDASQFVGAAHNIYLIWAAETGLVSLLCFLALWAFVAWNGWVARSSPHVPCLLGILLGLLLIGCCDFYPLTFQSGRLMLFLVGGLLVVQQPKRVLA